MSFSSYTFNLSQLYEINRLDWTENICPVPEIAYVKADTIVCGCSLLCVLYPGFTFFSKSCMGRIFRKEIDENSVTMILNLFYTKVDFMSLCVKASNVGILKLGARNYFIDACLGKRSEDQFVCIQFL